ncbi:hypothetical protein [Telmatocola sphagniphila]|nr:hypothetical protein [Telmatocola sphagniphila]
MSQVEVVEILGVSGMTVNRWLNRSLHLLTEALGDLRPIRNNRDQSELP